MSAISSWWAGLGPMAQWAIIIVVAVGILVGVLAAVGVFSSDDDASTTGGSTVVQTGSASVTASTPTPTPEARRSLF